MKKSATKNMAAPSSTALPLLSVKMRAAENCAQSTKRLARLAKRNFKAARRALKLARKATKRARKEAEQLREAFRIATKREAATEPMKRKRTSPPRRVPSPTRTTTKPRSKRRVIPAVGVVTEPPQPSAPLGESTADTGATKTEPTP